MTLPDIKAEMREEFWRFAVAHGFEGAQLKIFLSTALDRVAEETVKAIMPGEDTSMAVGFGDWNACRAAMLENYKHFTTPSQKEHD